jgi:hypothetical protein
LLELSPLKEPLRKTKERLEGDHQLLSDQRHGGCQNRNGAQTPEVKEEADEEDQADQEEASHSLHATHGIRSSRSAEGNFSSASFLSQSSLTSSLLGISVERRASSGEPCLESLVLVSLVGPGDLMLGNSVPCGNPDSALDSTFSYTLSYRSAPGEPERILRNRG